MDADGWSALARRLAGAPPTYVLVERRYVPLLAGATPRAAALADLLSARYRVAFTSERGTWYELRTASDAPAGPTSRMPSGGAAPGPYPGGVAP
jgi:hypothetical protein